MKLYEDPKGYFVNLPGRSLPLDPQIPLAAFSASIKDQHFDLQEVKMYDDKFVEYSSMTPLQVIMQENFLLKLNNEWYSVLTNTDEPLFDVEPTTNYNDHSIFNVCQNVGLSQRQAVVLGKFSSQLIDTLQKHLNNDINRKYVTMVVQKILLNSALNAKSEVADIDTKIAFLREKLSRYQEVKANVDQKLSNSSRKRVRIFLSFVFFQILLTQYGTYVAFNWDVMEPITCLLGIIDLIIAYGFWLSTSKSFSYSGMQSNYIEKYKARFAKKDELDLEEIEQIKKCITWLESKKLIYSPKLEDTLRAINLDLNTEEFAKNQEEEDSDDE